MRRLFATVLSVIALATAGLTSTSCIGDIFGDLDPSNTHRPGGGNHDNNGGNQGGNQGDNGGNQGGTQTSVFPGDDTYTLKADAIYYGDQAVEGVDEFVLYLSWGEYTENNDFKSCGTELAFDILCTKTSNMNNIPLGTYSCTDDNYSANHFLSGLLQDGLIYPSYAYYQWSKTENKTVCITGGTLQISMTKEGKYSIRANFACEGPDSSRSNSYLVLYEGEIPVVDGRSSSSDVPKDVEMKSFSRVVAENWGQLWEDEKTGETLPVSDWILYLYGENAENDSEYAMIEILAAPDAKTLTAGLYNEVAAVGNISAFKPGAVVAGYTDGEDNIAYGTWYCKGGTAYYAASKGQLAIASKNDVYSLTFDFTDEDETYGGSFKGTYTGKIEFVDNSVTTKAGCSRGRMMNKIQKNSAPSRNVKAARRI